jgi:glucose-1-phosphate adenylyltransferase
MDCDYVCNIDIGSAVSSHIERGADVTIICCELLPDMDICKNCVTIKRDEDGRAREMLMNRAAEGAVLSMNVFVVAKDMLISMIEDAMVNMYRDFERDILADKIELLNIQCHMHRGFTRRIYSTKSYYDATMSLLNYDNLTDLFTPDRPVYTKVRDEAPVRYGLNARVSNSLLADGCVVEGQAENCVLFRGVKIEAGAVVRNSIFMQNTVVRENAELNYVITDKDVVISSDRTLEGDLNYPLYIKKASTV